MSGIKKAAADAMKQLAHYLRRDKRGMDLLEDVHKYITALRRRNSELTIRNNSLLDVSETMRTVASSKSSTCSELRSSVQQLQATLAQSQRENTMLKEDVKRLKAQIAKPFSIISQDATISANYTAAEFSQTLKELMSRMRAPPQLLCGAKHGIGKYAFTVDLHSALPAMGEPHFSTLGMLAAVGALIGGGKRGDASKQRQCIAFGVPDVDKDFFDRIHEDKLMSRFVRWMFNRWFADTRLSKSFYLGVGPSSRREALSYQHIRHKNDRHKTNRTPFLQR